MLLALPLAAIFLVVLAGGIRFALDLQRKTSAPERRLESFIYAQKLRGDLYLTPIKMQDFRLETGAPVFVEFKSIPYKDTDVLEWYRRVRLANRFYANGSCDLLEKIARDEGITHVVLDSELRLPNCAGVEPIYQDARYILWRIQSP